MARAKNLNGVKGLEGGDPKGRVVLKGGGPKGSEAGGRVFRSGSGKYVCEGVLGAPSTHNERKQMRDYLGSSCNAFPLYRRLSGTMIISRSK